MLSSLVLSVCRFLLGFGLTLILQFLVSPILSTAHSFISLFPFFSFLSPSFPCSALPFLPFPHLLLCACLPFFSSFLASLSSHPFFPFFLFIYFFSCSVFHSPLFSFLKERPCTVTVSDTVTTHTHEHTLSRSHSLWGSLLLKVMCFGDLSVPLLLDSLTHTYTLRLPYMLPSAVYQLKYSSACQFYQLHNSFILWFAISFCLSHAHSLRRVWIKVWRMVLDLPGLEDSISSESANQTVCNTPSSTIKPWYKNSIKPA